MNEILTETHSWCFDGPDCILTWARQLALSRFHTATVGKARGFDPKKEPSTVKTNFGFWKLFLAYYYRVVHRGGPLYHAWRDPAYACGLCSADRSTDSCMGRGCSERYQSGPIDAQVQATRLLDGR
jgi:hypothetical protein